MPTTKTITLYTFDELSDDAKERAREWYRTCSQGSEIAWQEETRQSLREAIKHIRAGTIMGLKADDMPLTGYCMDAVAIEAAQRVFVAMDHPDTDPTEDRKIKHEMEIAATEAVDAAWEAECEYQNDDEQVDESIMCNEYTFTLDGKRA